MQNETLIFIHIPKTAGTSLMKVLAGEYGDKAVKIQCSPEYPDYRETFSGIPDDMKAALKLVAGHFPFGVHKYFSNPARYLTILRNPVSRIESLYYHHMRNPGNEIHEVIMKYHLSLLGFVEYFHDKISAINNGQTRILTGLHTVNRHPQNMPVTETHLEIAKANLKNRIHFGLAERLKETLLLFQSLFSWKPFDIPCKNVAEHEKIPLDEPTIQCIKSLNRFDLELYKFAENEFVKVIERRLHRSG